MDGSHLRCPALDLPAYLQARGGGSAEATAGRLADRVDEGDPDVIDALDLLLWELCHSARPARSTPETARAMRPVLKDMVREEWGPNSEWA